MGAFLAETRTRANACKFDAPRKTDSREPGRRHSYLLSMKRWSTVTTVRCAGCSVFTPEGEILLGTRGEALCGGCAASQAVPADAAGEREQDWVVELRPAIGWDRAGPGPVRAVAAAMVVLALAFPLAACLSQW
jgi:hypothetical protein